MDLVTPWPLPTQNMLTLDGTTRLHSLRGGGVLHEVGLYLWSAEGHGGGSWEGEQRSGLSTTGHRDPPCPCLGLHVGTGLCGSRGEAAQGGDLSSRVQRRRSCSSDMTPTPRVAAQVVPQGCASCPPQTAHYTEPYGRDRASPRQSTFAGIRSVGLAFHFLL